MGADVDPVAEAIAKIERLVAFETESAKSNLPLIDWIQSDLARQGVPITIFPNAGGDKAALFATFGPMIDGGVLLSGHTDVVPVTGQRWTSDPFRLRQDGGRLYGRGACDMKGFLGVALAMAEAFAAANLRRPIHLLLTYDEETTCLGPVDAIAQFGKTLPRPACVIVGEPTFMRVADAHKSVASYVTTVKGREGHSSRPANGASAIKAAGALVGELYRIGAEMSEGSTRFDPPGSTVSVGVIRGGSARNIIAGECALEWEFRGEPQVAGDTAALRLESYARAQILPDLRAQAAEATIETRCEVFVPGLRPAPGSAAESLAFRLTRTNESIAVSFASEAGRFQEAGLAVAICGPGSIAQAHQPNEFIEVDQIAACLGFMRGLVAELERPQT